MIPSFRIKNHLGKNFVFHSNLSIKQKVVKKFPKFYQELLTGCGKYLSSPSNVLSAVVSQIIWYNEYIKTDNNTIYKCHFSQKSLNRIGDLFENNGKMKCLRTQLGLDDNKKFYWRQVIHALSCNLFRVLW